MRVKPALIAVNVALFILIYPLMFYFLEITIHPSSSFWSWKRDKYGSIEFTRPMIERLSRVTVNTRYGGSDLWISYNNAFPLSLLAKPWDIVYEVECLCLTAVSRVGGWSFYRSSTKTSHMLNGWAYLPPDLDWEKVPTTEELAAYLRRAETITNETFRRFKDEIHLARKEAQDAL